MSKRHDTVHDIENNRVIYHTIVVQLSKVFDFSNSSLIELEVVLFQTKHNVFEDIVNYCSDEILVIAIQRTDQNCK